MWSSSVSYQGRVLTEADAMALFAKGAFLDQNQYSLVIAARIECGGDRYAWLNNVIAVGTGD